MKKRFSGIIAVAAALAMTVPGSAFAMDAAELNRKAAEAFKDVKQYTVSFDGGADAVMNVVQAGEDGATMEVPIKGSMTGTAAFSLEPLAAAEQIEFGGSAMGQDIAGTMQMYLAEQEDGSAAMYTKTDISGAEGEWQAVKVGAEDVSRMKEGFAALQNEGVDGFIDKFADEEGNTADKEQIKALAAALTEKVNGMTQVSEDVYSEDGILCDEAVCDLTGDALVELAGDVLGAAKEAGAEIDEETTNMVNTFASLLDIRTVADYEKETGLPVSAKIDLAGSDFSAIAQMFGSVTGIEDAAFGISVSRLDMNCRIDCTAPVSVEIPEEALAAPLQESGASLEELGSIAENLGGENETEGDDAYQDGAVINEDGSYHIEDTDFDGVRLAFDVPVPEGMEVLFATDTSVYFNGGDDRASVSYAAVTYENADELLKEDTDTTYMEGQEDYSDIAVTDVKEVALENGLSAKYAAVSYKYGDYNASRTYVAVPVGDHAIQIQIEKSDENYDPVEVTEEDIVRFAGAVSLSEE